MIKYKMATAYTDVILICIISKIQETYYKQNQPPAYNNQKATIQRDCPRDLKLVTRKRFLWFTAEQFSWQMFS